MTEWYYTKMGLKQGPVPEEELRQKIRRGEIGDATLVWRDGMADWLPLSGVGELKADVTTENSTGKPQVEDAELKQVSPEKIVDEGMSPPALTLPVSKTSGNIQMEQPAAYHGNYVAPNIPSYLVLSIIGTVISAILVLLFCISPGLITGIVAIVYGSKVDGLKAQGDLISANSASRTAKVWMIVTYVLMGLVILGGIGLVIFALLPT